MLNTRGIHSKSSTYDPDKKKGLVKLGDAKKKKTVLVVKYAHFATRSDDSIQMLIFPGYSKLNQKKKKKCQRVGTEGVANYIMITQAPFNARLHTLKKSSRKAPYIIRYRIRLLAYFAPKLRGAQSKNAGRGRGKEDFLHFYSNRKFESPNFRARVECDSRRSD